MVHARILLQHTIKEGISLKIRWAIQGLVAMTANCWSINSEKSGLLGAHPIKWEYGVRE
jgi:hypothetical protein